MLSLVVLKGFFSSSAQRASGTGIAVVALGEGSHCRQRSCDLQKTCPALQEQPPFMWGPGLHGPTAQMRPPPGLAAREVGRALWLFRHHAPGWRGDKCSHGCQWVPGTVRRGEYPFHTGLCGKLVRAPGGVGGVVPGVQRGLKGC